MELSQTSLAFRTKVEDEDGFLDTCDGGDPGTPKRRSVWLLGIEPGWSLSDEAVDRQNVASRAAELAAYSIELQLKWPFNRSAFKLLCAVNGGAPADYRAFAQQVRPFERGSSGYFKANLFSEPCSHVGEWDARSAAKTGFTTKADYRSWMRENRFRVIKTWIDRCQPRLVIGVGLTHLADFLTITGTCEIPPVRVVSVNGHVKRLHIATSGTVPVAVVPHLSGGPHGLNSNVAIGLAAEQIRHVLGL